MTVTNKGVFQSHEQRIGTQPVWLQVGCQDTLYMVNEG